MSWPSSILVAALTGALGFATIMVVTSALNDWFRFYNNGDIGGAWLMVIIGALGAIVLFVFGLVVSRAAEGTPEPNFFRPLGISGGTVIALGAAVLLVGWLRADIPPKLDGQSIELAVELRAPAGFSLPKVGSDSDATAGVRAGNGRARSYGYLDLKRAREIDGQWIITARAALDTNSKKKVMEVSVGKGTDLTFQLPLAAHPSRSDMEWSPWIDSDVGAGPAATPPEKSFSLRYRVKVAGLTREELEAKKAEEEQARFDSLDASTPIEAWLNHTIPGTPGARTATAVKHIVSRPNYVAELSAVMAGNSDEFAMMALEIVAQLPPPQPALVPHVASAGRDIARRIREVNAGAVGDDPHPSGGHSAAMRFTAWMTAVRALREKSGGDFTPELGEILVLSRVRPKTALLQENVRGVASHYMKEWAKVEPLPGDPKPANPAAP